MANPAKEARDKAQITWPGATVSERGRGWIKHQHPTDANRHMLDSHIGPIHYGAGDEIEIDTAWEPGVYTGDEPWLFKMVKAGFNVYMGSGTTDFDSGQIVRYVHPASGEDVTFEAQQIQWTNDLDQIEAIADPQQIGHTSIDDDTINWIGAYGAGLDFRWQAQTARLAKYLTIQSLAAIGAPPQFIIDGGNPVLRMPFIFQKSSGIDIYIDGVLWNEKSNNPKTTSGNVEFRLNGESLWWFKQATAQDSSDDTELPIIQQRFRAQAQNLLVEVLVPWSWLESAVYPVEIDPTIDDQVGTGADDGRISGTSTYDATSGAAYVGRGPGITDAKSWFRFTGISGLSGATIGTSYFEPNFNSTNGTATKSNVYAEDAAAPGYPTTFSDYNSKTTTTAFITWDDDTAGSGFRQSSSTNTIIQELADSYDPSVIQILWKDDGSANNNWYNIRTYDGDSSFGAKLHIEYTAGGGTTYYETPSGTLTSSGTIIKKTSVSYAGTLTSSGTLATLGTFFRALAGTLTSAGTVVKETAVSYAGTLTSAGTIAKETIVSYAGTLTSSGVLATVKTTLLSLAGTLTSSGTLVKNTVVSYAGTLTSSGTLIKETALSFAGTLTSSGVVTSIKTTLIALSGTLTSSGTLVKETAVSYAGAVTSAGTVVKETAVSYAGTLTSSGSLVRKTITALGGVLTSAGDLATQFTGGAGEFYKSLVGTLTSSGNLTKRTSISLAGTLTSAGTVVKGMFISLAGTLTSAGNLALIQGRLLVGTLTSSGTITKQAQKSFAGTLTSTGTIIRKTAKALAGTLSSAGSLASVLNVNLLYKALTVRARSFSLTVQTRSSDLVLKSRDFLLTLIDRGLE